ncbi:hypothetical protein FIBSPDRAFT_874775, partial [Athelia psychrophila]
VAMFYPFILSTGHWTREYEGMSQACCRGRGTGMAQCLLTLEGLWRALDLDYNALDTNMGGHKATTQRVVASGLSKCCL